MKRSPSRFTTTPKGTKFHKNRRLLVHIAELSTAVVEVAIKVTNATLCLKKNVHLFVLGITQSKIGRFG